jgi:hypothetical protein
MPHRIKLMYLSIALILGLCDFAHAKPLVRRIWGTLNPVSFGGTCGPAESIATDNSVLAVMGLWFLRDSQDTHVSPRGLEVKGIGQIGGPLPNEFVNLKALIPGTPYFYISEYRLSRWKRRAKTVKLRKQSWIFEGWGTGTKILCYASWAGRVKYR